MLHSSFLPHTGFHVHCCTKTPPISLAQCGGDTAPAETTTSIGCVGAFVTRSSLLTALDAGSHRVWSWKVQLLPERPELVGIRKLFGHGPMQVCSTPLTHVASCQSGCVVNASRHKRAVLRCPGVACSLVYSRAVCAPTHPLTHSPTHPLTHPPEAGCEVSLVLSESE